MEPLDRVVVTNESSAMRMRGILDTFTTYGINLRCDVYTNGQIKLLSVQLFCAIRLVVGTYHYMAGKSVKG